MLRTQLMPLLGPLVRQGLSRCHAGVGGQDVDGVVDQDGHVRRVDWLQRDLFRRDKWGHAGSVVLGL